MGITDKLREWANGDSLRAGMSLRVARDQALAIADRIDAEYDETVRELNDLASSSISLPVDAKGKLIRIGDMMECMLDGAKRVMPVGYMTCRTDGWHIALTIDESYRYQSYSPKELHHSNDTWERIIKDAMGASESDELSSGSYEQAVTALVARCKALAGDAE